MATMQDIADRVGVSRATVSNILNGKYVAEHPSAVARAEQIREVASRIGYRCSSAARATRTGRTSMIGMIRSPSLRHSVHNNGFEDGLDDALHQRGLCLVRDVIGDEAERAPRIVRENPVDGLLINYAAGTPRPVRDLLDRCRIPAVWVNRLRSHNCVRPNDRGAAAEATRHLIRHGHRRIALVQYARHPEDEERHYSADHREAGFAEAMTGAGLVPRVHHLPPPPAADRPGQDRLAGPLAGAVAQAGGVARRRCSATTA